MSDKIESVPFERLKVVLEAVMSISPKEYMWLSQAMRDHYWRLNDEYHEADFSDVLVTPPEIFPYLWEMFERLAGVSGVMHNADEIAGEPTPNVIELICDAMAANPDIPPADDTASESEA